MAKSFLDTRQLDLQFNPLFIKQVFSSEHSSFAPISKSGDHFEDSLLKIKVCLCFSEILESLTD